MRIIFLLLLSLASQWNTPSLAAAEFICPGPVEAIIPFRGEASITPASVTANGLSSPPRRFTIPDRGEPIPYLVDADALPAGISFSQAMEAVEAALAAWAEVSSVTFQFEGTASFGMAANNVQAADGRLRIQLHDTYDSIGSSQTLGFGGQFFETIGGFESGGTGGGVDGIEFHRTTAGFVVLNHSVNSMQNLKTFEAVLAHEIGHALGLAHSSEDPDETDPYLHQAIMYYRIQTDDRGATLADWDLDTIARTHPVDTPPPFGFDRFMRIVTGHHPLSNPEVNQITIRGYSLHADQLTPELSFTTSNNGAFSLDAEVLTFTPAAAFSDSDELDPAEGQFYDSTYIRFNDGMNRSPPVAVRVVQFLLDTQPSGAPDGLPDSWATEHFGSATPVSGVSGAHDDPDGDGLTNLQEFLLGTDPQDPNSRFTVMEINSSWIRFQARPYEVYELHGSTDLIHWEPLNLAVQPESSTGQFATPSANDSQKKFFRVEKVR